MKRNLLLLSIVLLIVMLLSCKPEQEQVATPTFNPPTGVYTSIQSVTISCDTEDAEIRYTLDGTDPSQTNGEIYSTPIEVSESTTIKAIAYKEGIANSQIAIATYAMNVQQVATPVFSPSSGTILNNDTEITITTATSGANIYYTRDGSTPTTSSELYSDTNKPLVDGTHKTIKAIAVKTGILNSTIAEGTYNLMIATPTFTPEGGTYLTIPPQIEITTITSGANIRYTLDGTTPTTTTGSPYTGPISISGPKIVKAIAYKTGWDNSNISTSSYYILSQITDGNWINGNLEAGYERWYYFSAENQGLYKVKWDDRLEGSGTCYCNVKVSAYRQDKTTPYFTEINSGYSNPQFIIAKATEEVYIKVEGYNSTESGTFALSVSLWTQATSSASWSTRSYHTSVVYDNKMWIIGGYGVSGPKNDVWYSSDGITWTQATSSASWSARDSHTSVVYDNKMWVIGGYASSSYKNDVWYSINGITWTQAPSAPWSARCFHTSVVYDNKMWVMGGAISGGSKNDVWFWWW